MTDRYWFDSWPGIDLNLRHPILDYYKTPYEGPEFIVHSWSAPNDFAFDGAISYDAPYTTVSQNRGGIA